MMLGLKVLRTSVLIWRTGLHGGKLCLREPLSYSKRPAFLKPRGKFLLIAFRARFRVSQIGVRGSSHACVVISKFPELVKSPRYDISVCI